MTGQTHVVDALAAAILAQLTDVPISEPELIARLTDVIPAEAVSADLNAAVASALADMDRLGLVDPVGQP